MRRLFLLIFALLGLIPAVRAQNGTANGWCDEGATAAQTQGLASTNRLQGIIPSCTITVYQTGTLSLATIFDHSGVPLDNPFTASTSGQWSFDADATGGYDVFLSGGIAPLVYTIPVSIINIHLNGGTGGGGSAVTAGWFNNVATTQGISDNTIVLNSTSGIPPKGLYFVDGEYESFTGISGNTLTGVTRGVNNTTPAVHNPGAAAISINFLLSTIPGFGIFSTGPGTLAINNGFAATGNPLTINAGSNELDVLTDGTIRQFTNSGINYFNQFEVGVPGGHSDGTNFHVPVTDSSFLVQDNAPHELNQPIGDNGGWAGAFMAIPAPNVGAATLIPQFISTTGSCNITYVVTGVDRDGVEVPGTASTINSLGAPWGFPAQVAVRYPSAAGLVSYNAYRTVVSGGCPGLATGKFASGITGNFGGISDFYSGGDSSSPPGSNLSVAKSCVGSSATLELSCRLAGPGPTPAAACSSTTRSWIWADTNATATPFAYVCNGTSWVTAY